MKKVLILHTGGTIGMVSSKSPRKGEEAIALRPSLLGPHFLDRVPELSKMAKIKLVVLDNIDSSNVTPDHWTRWFTYLKENYSHYDGFVITHGTDTMAYTGAALSFAMGRTNKPVVFTGSQRPLMHLRTDARDNLINAVEMSCHGPKEVSLCFGNKLYRANRCIKLSASDYVAFESFNFPPLATMGVEIEPLWKNFSSAETVKSGKPQWRLGFDKRVFSFKIFPGISSEIINAAILTDASRGIVLEAFGSGNVPSIDKSLLNTIELATSLSKPVVIVSQCPHGRVDLDMYACGIEAKKRGAISAGDMTREATLVKLMHGLSLKLSREKLFAFMLKNICGEKTTIGPAAR